MPGDAARSFSTLEGSTAKKMAPLREAGNYANAKIALSSFQRCQGTDAQNVARGKWSEICMNIRSG